MISNKTKESLIKGAIAGGILSAATSILYGNGAVEVMGYELPAAIPIFVAGAGASLATDALSSQLNLPTTSSQKIADLTSLAISSGVSGAGAIAILKLTSGIPNENILPVFAIAAASQAGSDYVVHRWLEDTAGQLIMF